MKPEPIDKMLGQRITAALTQKEKPQSWLAERMKVSDESVSKWILGKSDPKFSRLKQLARVLGCSVGYLSGDDPDDRIARVAQLMAELEDAGRQSVLDGVKMMHATLPKRHEGKQRA